MSSGPSLLIRFYANGGTGLGYKAFYSFVVGHAFDKSVQPITDCGGYVENLGGAITMMDMVGEGVKTYDCVWLIRPPKNFLHMKTHMYLKVVAFADMGECPLSSSVSSDPPPLSIYPSTFVFGDLAVLFLFSWEHRAGSEAGSYLGSPAPRDLKASSGSSATA